ncbi:MAG: translation initiation factor IF-2 [Candidatus Hydrothermarchaeales archaeon]
MLRQPVVSVLGHVDHGKTSLLDRIRGSAIAEREAGGITQHIGATEVPIEVLHEICGGLLKQLKVQITISGLLFIDTPGHAAFTTLRKRGGALADLAILVVDITEGFQPQTLEALNILKTYKTPFLVVANKIDKIKGWQKFDNYPFTHSFSKQTEEVRTVLEGKLYDLVGKLYEEGFEAERFDRVDKFEKQISIMPVSAKTGEGIPELLMMLVGLTQKFLEKSLSTDLETPARGTILEVKEEKGLGITLDVIIYDGTIRVGDTILVGAKGEPIITKVRSILKPKPLDEIRDPKFRFNAEKEAHASCGVKIVAPNLADALAGSPIWVSWDEEELANALEELKSEIKEVAIEEGQVGVVVKADTLGALEALIKMLSDEEIPIYKANVGDISRRDIVDAETVKEEAPIRAVVFGFNVKILKDAEDKARETGLQIFQGKVIYKLIEDYLEWSQQQLENEKKRELTRITRPGKIRILPGYVFRSSKPAIVGVEILGGLIRSNYKLINKDGKRVGVVKGIQDKGENIDEATKDMQVAVAIAGAIVGKQIKEKDVLYTELEQDEARLIEEKYFKQLPADELEVFEEIKVIKRKASPIWAMK